MRSKPKVLTHVSLMNEEKGSPTLAPKIVIIIVVARPSNMNV